jgi:hypothetical protein
LAEFAVKIFDSDPILSVKFFAKTEIS